MWVWVEACVGELNCQQFRPTITPSPVAEIDDGNRWADIIIISLVCHEIALTQMMPMPFVEEAANDDDAYNTEEGWNDKGDARGGRNGTSGEQQMAQSDKRHRWSELLFLLLLVLVYRLAWLAGWLAGGYSSL